MTILRSSYSATNEARLRGQSVYLRLSQLRDWREWAEVRAASREFLAPWEPTWPGDALSRSAFRRRIRRQLREGQDDLGYAFFVFRRTDDCLMGGVTLTNVQRGAAQSCNVGYWIGKQFGRHGYMTDALNATLEYCFGALGLHRVEAACMPSNKASQALLERSGMRLEGYAREYLRINGAWRDHVLYAAIAEEWRAAKRGAR